MDLSLLHERLRRKYDLVILVNPNSPTGTFVQKRDLGPALAEAARVGTRVWLDETYVDYVGRDQSLERLAAKTPGLFICKSMSKVFALSGMRLAYLCGHPDEIAAARAITPPWVVGMAAQVAGVRALQDPSYYAARYEQTRAYRAQMAADLRQLGMNVLEGSANFVLMEGEFDASELVKRCVSRGVYLRDTASMGVRGNHSVRIAIKSPEGNARIVAAIASALDSQMVDRDCSTRWKRESDQVSAPTTLIST